MKEDQCIDAPFGFDPSWPLAPPRLPASPFGFRISWLLWLAGGTWLAGERAGGQLSRGSERGAAGGRVGAESADVIEVG